MSFSPAARQVFEVFLLEVLIYFLLSGNLTFGQISIFIWIARMLKHCNRGKTGYQHCTCLDIKVENKILGQGGAGRLFADLKNPCGF